ncbi:hypothetical protein D3C84_1175720 [compost metagenome]
MLATFDIGAQLLLSLLSVEKRVFFHRLLNFVIAFIGRVVGQHVEDEALFYGLLHAVEVEWFEATIS